MTTRPIRALTILQPWAHLIVRGRKRVENRTWEPAARGLRVGDYLAIHAGTWHTRRGGPIEGWAAALEIARERSLFERVPMLAEYERIVTGERGRLYAARCNSYIEQAVPYSAVVGVAQLVGVETEAPAEVDPWWYGPLGWRLGDVTAIEPVPCRGSQGLWEMPDEVLATVRARWKAARPQPATEATS